MKHFTKFLAIAVLFFSVPFLHAQSDPYEEVFLLAEKLENSGAVSEAFTEYKRYLFLQDYSEGIHEKEAYLALSRIFKNDSKYTKALENLQMAQNFSSGEELIIEEINLLREYSVTKKPSLESNVNLFRYRFTPEFSDTVKKAAWIAILENEIVTEEFQLFHQNFDFFCSEYPDYFTEETIIEIKKNLEKAEKFKPKNPMLAFHLSFIPGLGQLYAGQPADALNAFLLNGSLIALSTYTIISQDYFTFGLFELEPTLRFYRGNLLNAQKETYQYNEKKINQLKKPILDSLN